MQTPDEVIVQSTAPDPSTTLRGELQLAGVAVVSVAEAPVSDGYWVVKVDPAAKLAAIESLGKAPGVVFAQPTYTLTGGRTGSYAPLNILSILFKKEADQTQIDSIAEALELGVIRPPRPDSGYFEHVFRYEGASRGRPLATAAALYKHPLVRWASPIGMSPIFLSYVPPDPFYPLQFHLRSDTLFNGVRVDINAQPAWDVTKGSSAIKVGVIGDGVDFNHLDLLGAFNGSLGFDAIHQPTWTDNAFFPFGDDTHETSAAGIIFADHNSQGVSGVAPLTKLRAARIFRNTFNRPFPEWIATPQQVANAINWAWQTGQSDVINNSWHYGDVPQTVIDQAIDNALTLGRSGKGTVVVFAAGNRFPEPIPEPNNHPGVLTVGALRPTGPRAAYSQIGAALDIMAPSGTDTDSCLGQIVTTDRFGNAGCNDGPAGNIDYTKSFSGTSAAAPQVAGVAALILSTQPTLTVSQVRSRICATAIPWGAANEFGCGKLDAGRAVTLPPTVAITGPSSVRPNVACTWTANVSGGLSPYSYSWTVNSSAVGGNTSTLVYQNTGSSFTVNVLVADAAGASVPKAKSVTVSAGAPQCGS